MKRTVCIILALAAALALAACSGGTPDADKESSAPVTSAPAQATPETTGAKEEAKTPDVPDYGECDIDLTAMNSTMVYSQVSDFLVSPDDYLGKTVKMQGTFAVYETAARNYYACVIADATACCQQGIEFVLAGEHAYPGDYPELDDEITVTGVFDTYYEGQNRYVQLINAKMG